MEIADVPGTGAEVGAGAVLTASVGLPGAEGGGSTVTCGGEMVPEPEGRGKYVFSLIAFDGGAGSEGAADLSDRFCVVASFASFFSNAARLRANAELLRAGFVHVLVFTVAAVGGGVLDDDDARFGPICFCVPVPPPEPAAAAFAGFAAHRAQAACGPMSHFPQEGHFRLIKKVSS